MALLAGNDNRNGHESAHGEDDIRFQFPNQPFGFAKSFENTERIGEFLPESFADILIGRISPIRTVLSKGLAKPKG